MSGNSGIKCSKHLNKTFGKAISKNIRCIVCSIKDESEIVDVIKLHACGDWRQDFEKITSELTPQEPYYILYRMDSTDKLNSEWLLFTYIPESSSVRKKMLYSSSKQNLKLGLGTLKILHDIFASSLDELSLDGYDRYLRHLQTDAPLMPSEELRQQMDTSLTHKDNIALTSMVVSFPVSQETASAFEDFRRRKLNYLGITIDPTTERMNLIQSNRSIDLDMLAYKIPSDAPLFHFFSWDHVYEGKNTCSVIFIYSCPDDCDVKNRGMSIRLKMLFSSGKSHIIEIAKNFGINVDYKFEVSSGQELIEKDIMQCIHGTPLPSNSVTKQKFERLKPPGRVSQSARNPRN
ncbi:twinfilin-like isoform X1 [Schistocerca gregaria]|uniref:twinfilin-like isoform X1 n=1 Tax=Schistocerca gregaria TaxID=7010 RepID=UPI00211E5372|nr:twinfilin-like isoform X1 [Schistocerca gregaria]XP_049848531.1 twinfilin-like isoform X1 [Schistocerca gregaria]XP_049848532.1 twinfilin-like isoform X1 [Schistocerca gregaria]